MLMRKVRGLIYKVGFRPRPGSILCSPSLMFVYGMDKAMRDRERDLKECLKDITTRLSENVTPGVFTVCTGTSAAIAETLLQSAEGPFYSSCVVCGTVEP